MSPRPLESGPAAGLVVYVWGRDEQDRLIRDCLAPELEARRKSGDLTFAWFDRFAARGPHLFFILDMASGFEALCQRLETYLAEHPSEFHFDEKELVRRHAQCRGKILCEVDTRPGLAENNTFVALEHPKDDYPFFLIQGHPRKHEVWGLVDELYAWMLRQIATVGRTERIPHALAWAVEVDRAMGGETHRYWGFHAETLWPALRDQNLLATEDFQDRSRELVGQRNAATFGKLWTSSASGAPEGLARRLVEALDPAPSNDWQFLREINHWTLKNLGLPVRSHLPLALYGWQRGLERSQGTPR
ncbi:MAG: hypothetical protein AAGD06_04295 [Acidobacteriota bacterium]